MKYLTTLCVVLCLSSSVFAERLPYNLTYSQVYCTPDGTNNSACYNTILAALTPVLGETLSNLVVQNEVFSDNTLASAIVNAQPRQLFTATSIDQMDSLVASKMYSSQASMYYVEIPAGNYSVKTAVSLKRRTSDGYYKLTIVSGNYNFTRQASLYDYESIVTLTSDWVKPLPLSDAYDELITLTASYLSRLYTQDQLKMLFAKAAAVAYNAPYSSTCDYFGAGADVVDPALNALDKKLC